MVPVLVAAPPAYAEGTAMPISRLSEVTGSYLTDDNSGRQAQEGPRAKDALRLATGGRRL